MVLALLLFIFLFFCLVVVGLMSVGVVGFLTDVVVVLVGIDDGGGGD